MKASIIHNTNRLISSSEASWGSIRENSLVRFLSDESFYTIGTISNFLYIKEFLTVSHNVIKINSDIGIELSIGEILDVTAKEYEVLTLDPLNNGQGYRPTETLYIDGGTPSKDMVTNEIFPAKFTVLSVGPEGQIKQLKMESAGRYLLTPNEESALIGGSGSGATVKILFKPTDTRSIFEKTITKIEKNTGNTLIMLDSSLLPGISSGKISCSKWQAALTSSYAGASKTGEDIEFLKDFTPFLRIPFIARNNPNPEVVYNTALMSLDKVIQQLSVEVQKLKTRNSR